MTTLRQQVHKSIKEHPRDITDLFRSIALFIPEDHRLSSVTAGILESLKFSPPEHHRFFLGQFLRQMDAHFPESQVPIAPWWVRVIFVLITGGSPESEELIASFDHQQTAEPQITLDEWLEDWAEAVESGQSSISRAEAERRWKKMKSDDDGDVQSSE